MSVQTTILDLAMVIYDEAVAMLVEMLRRSRLVDTGAEAQTPPAARPLHRGLPVRALRASA
jgi:hypothetical protein